MKVVVFLYIISFLIVYTKSDVLVETAQISYKEQEPFDYPNPNSSSPRRLTIELLKKLFSGLGKHKEPQNVIPLPPPVVQTAVIQRPVLLYSVPSPVVEVQRVIKERSCPHGATLTPEGCCIVEILQPLRRCSVPEAKIVGMECIVHAIPKAVCPPGFQLTNDRCTQCERFPAEFTCQNGETLDPATKRSCLATIPGPLECPVGFSLMDGKDCVRDTVGQYECPPGFSRGLSPTECTRRESFPATLVCPEGSSPDPLGERCEIIKVLPPECPKHFEFNAALQLCARQVPEVPASCPEGFVPHLPTGCQREVITPARPTCPEAFQLNESGTECIRMVQPPPECPPGYLLSTRFDSQCEKQIPAKVICPPGATLHGSNSCQVTIRQPAIQTCPPGFQTEAGRNECLKMELHPPVVSCETEECFAVRQTPIAFACPEGARFIDDPSVPKCGLPNKGCACKADAGEPCQKDETWCAADQREEITIAEPVCPEGGVPEDGRCILREPMAPRPSCNSGTLDARTQQCQRRVTVPIRFECPPGTIREQSSTCISYETTFPPLTCPPGAVLTPDNTCSYLAPLLPPPPVTSIAPVSMVCGLGILRPDSTCVRWDTLPLEMACPPGAVKSPTSGCLLTTDLILPPPKVRAVRASYTCPTGSVRRGRECHLPEVVPALVVCPPGSLPMPSGTCQTVVDAVSRPRLVTTVAIPTCPPDTVPSGTSCVRTHDTPMSALCPEGFSLNEGSCVQATPAFVTCPPGSQLGPEGCVRRKIIPSITKIVEGCVYERPCTACPAAKSVCHRL